MSAMNLLAIRKSSQPPDPSHHYGHGKVENLAAVFQTLVIVFSGSYIIYASIQKWLDAQKITYSIWDGVVMIVSLIFSFLISRRLQTIGETTGSQALKADALHYTSDLYSNSAALIAIVLTYFSGQIFFDLLFAVMVGGIIIFSAGLIAKNALLGLMDFSISTGDQEKLISLLAGKPYPFAGFHKLRTRTSGSKIYADLHALFCRALKIEEAHERSRELELEIARAIPSMDVIIHIEPCEQTCEVTEESCKIRHPESSNSIPLNPTLP
jgi:cation diffusion facilitator family transporter